MSKIHFLCTSKAFSMKRKVLIIYTGGTIGMEKDHQTGSLFPFNFERIFQKIPEIHLLDCQVEVHAFSVPVDSSDMAVQEWQEIAKIIAENYQSFDGFLILHGTDTMAYTASALSFMLKGLRKPVLLTGSQLPIGDLRTDAKENLLTSLYYASLYDDSGKAVLQEVAIYFEYKLLRGNRSTKYSAEFFDAYRSPNFPIIGQSGVHLHVDKSLLYRAPLIEDFGVDYHMGQGIVFWRIFPSMDFSLLLHIPDMQILVLQVYGSGTITSDNKIEKTLAKLREDGVEIIIISQCTSGEIQFGKYENSNVFSRINAINGRDITPEAALTKAMHLHGNPNYDCSFSQLFSENLRGEKSSEINYP